MTATLLLLYAIFQAQMAVFATVSYTAIRLVGARVTKIGFGFPSVIPVKRTPEIKLGPIPGASLEIYGSVENIDDTGAWRKLPLGKRLLATFAPWIVIFAIACACIGPSHAAGSFVRAFRQLVWADMMPLVKKLLALVEHAPLATTMGILFAKLTAFNLLPLGGLTGGFALQELATPRGRPMPRGVTLYFTISMLVVLVWIGGRFVWALTRIVF